MPGPYSQDPGVHDLPKVPIISLLPEKPADLLVGARMDLDDGAWSSGGRRIDGRLNSGVSTTTHHQSAAAGRLHVMMSSPWKLLQDQ